MFGRGMLGIFPSTTSVNAVAVYPSYHGTRKEGRSGGCQASTTIMEIQLDHGPVILIDRPLHPQRIIRSAR